MTLKDHILTTDVQAFNAVYPKILFAEGNLSVLASGNPDGDFDVAFEHPEPFPAGESLWIIKNQMYGTLICKLTVSESGGGEEPSLEFMSWTSTLGTFFDSNFRFGQNLFDSYPQGWPLPDAAWGTVGDTSLHLNPDVSGIHTVVLVNNDGTDEYEDLAIKDQGGRPQAAPTSIVDYGEFYLLGPIVPNGTLAGVSPYIKVVKIDKTSDTSEVLTIPTPALSVHATLNSVLLNGIITAGWETIMHFDVDTETVTELPFPEGYQIYSINPIRDNIFFIYGEDTDFEEVHMIYVADGVNSTYFEIALPAGGSYMEVLPRLVPSDDNNVYLPIFYANSLSEYFLRVETRALNNLGVIVNSAEFPLETIESGLEYLNEFTAAVEGNSLVLGYRPVGPLSVDRLSVLDVRLPGLTIENSLDIPDASPDFVRYVTHMNEGFVYVIRRYGMSFIDRSTFTLSATEFIWADQDSQIYLFDGLSTQVRKHIIDAEDNIIVASSTGIAYKIHPSTGVLPIILSGENRGRFFPQATTNAPTIDFTPEANRILTLNFEVDGNTVVWRIIPMIPGTYVAGHSIS